MYTNAKGLNAKVEITLPAEAAHRLFTSLAEYMKLGNPPKRSFIVPGFVRYDNIVRVLDVTWCDLFLKTDDPSFTSSGWVINGRGSHAVVRFECEYLVEPDA